MNEIIANNPFRVGHKYFKFQISNFKLFKSKPIRVGRPPRRTCDHNAFSSSADYTPFRVGRWHACDHAKKIPSAFFASRYVGMEGWLPKADGVGHKYFKFQISNFKFFKPRNGDIIKNPLLGGVAAEGRRGGLHSILLTLNSTL